jgi:integrase
MSTPLLSPPSVCQDYVSAFTIASARELIGKSSLLRNHMMSSLRYDRQSFNQGGHPKEKRDRIVTLALRLNDICSRFGAAPRVVLPRWPLGTRQRVWFDVLAYTGLRRGDAVLLRRQHLRNGIATIKTEKTGSVVTLPILATLAETLSAGPCGDLTFIAGMNGRPLTKESFGNLFRQACREGGLINRSAHGLQKAAATRATEHGATEAELEAIFGWSGGRMASLYTRAANRQRLSIAAMNKLENDRRTSIPSPLNKVRAPGRKDQ